MSKDDLQETNVSPEAEPITLHQIRAMIVGDEDKVKLLNIFDNLVADNNKLKAELDAGRKANDEANV
tara:strand:+ start:1465 stop:1665 length:201 start_codon:yes stop_codon:yes gene_type:complete